MKAEYKPTVEDSSVDHEQNTSDPFAVDLFSDRGSTTANATGLAAATDTVPAPAAGVAWISRLPRVSESEFQASAAISSLSPTFYAKLRDTATVLLAQFTHHDSDQISIQLVELQETNFSDVSTGTDDIYVTFATQPNSAPLVLRLDPRFCVMIIDRMLGGPGAAAGILRSLTTAERAVVEFVSLNLTEELNRHAGQPLFRVESISEKAPPRLVRHQDQARGLVAALRIDVGELNGVARVYLPAKSLTSLDDAQRRLRKDTFSDFAEYTRTWPDVNLSVLLGHTDLAVEDFSQLETGDVMTLEWQSTRWRQGRFYGSVSVRVGASEETVINGDVLNESETGDLRLRVSSLKFEKPNLFAGRTTMQEEVENIEELGEANQVDGVMLTVRVELAARRLRMDELIRLRVNQVMDLGCQATDPVDLVVDDRRVARGELVDIEGRLGVRITQVLR
jgi:flagellar motor switch/type III secretory pathway protein FliN